MDSSEGLFLDFFRKRPRTENSRLFSTKVGRIVKGTSNKLYRCSFFFCLKNLKSFLIEYLDGFSIFLCIIITVI